MSECQDMARGLTLWAEALDYNGKNGGEFTESGMLDLSILLFKAGRLLADADRLIGASHAAFYNPADLPSNVTVLRKPDPNPPSAPLAAAAAA